MITVKRKVLFGDCDPEGIVYTPRFSHFALEATHEAMTALLEGPAITTMKARGVLTPVRAFNLEFLTPVTWDQELQITVAVLMTGKHSFTLQVEAYLQPRVLAFTATITYVTLSATNKQKVPLPEWLKSALSAYAE
ncbi:thioesterase family protein [uncultured Microbulbifer sp.]|uniref:acyl-CoA thioesterase n=1 Tax=uncultured Microbulbifer sp. TaxID=348147 RepID=UPI00261D4C1B|nr:thioesterase family protein [uncultured Microbulbifer sp.]